MMLRQFTHRITSSCRLSMKKGIQQRGRQKQRRITKAIHPLAEVLLSTIGRPSWSQKGQ
jgi:hypothetical protein